MRTVSKYILAGQAQENPWRRRIVPQETLLFSNSRGRSGGASQNRQPK